MKTLNCKRVARMISLYVAGDLVGASERDIVAHLATCEACRQLAEEFAESRSLLTEACRAPEFGAEFYSGIRHAVLGEIKRDQILSKRSLFRRRWLYATSFAALVIASGVMLQLFSGARRETPQGLARAPQVKDQPISDQTEGPSASSSLRPSQLPGTLTVPSHRILALVNRGAGSRQFETVRRPYASVTDRTAPDKRTQIGQAGQSLTSASTSASTSLSPAALGPAAVSRESLSSPSGRTSSSQISRIEIQTADPNIRIIWLVPREPREGEESNDDQDHNENGNRK